jgi:Tol biopolymer transport system component
MTKPFDRRLSAWLEEDARGRVADHLSEVLVATRATRQRPAWSSLERWLPMTSIATRAPFATPRRVLPVLIVLALLIAAIAAFAAFQIGRSRIPPFGEAANGRIVYADDATVYSVAPDGSDRQTIAVVPAGPFGFAVSPDGDLVAYAAENDHLEIARVDGGRPPLKITVPGMSAYGLAAWSANGDRVAFVASDKRGDNLFIANADGTNAREVAADSIPDGDVLAWIGFSPDGRSLAFIEGAEGTNGRMIVTAADGTQPRSLATATITVEDGGSVAWSPDPSTPRILYVAPAGGTRYFDLATNTDVAVASGFWATWSPTGDRISYWSNGTKVVDTPTSSGLTAKPTEVFPSFAGACGDHPEMAGKAFCGPAVWSPDGTRLIATEVLGHGVLSLRSDGHGDPILIDLTTDTNPGHAGYYVWQPRLR